MANGDEGEAMCCLCFMFLIMMAILGPFLLAPHASSIDVETGNFSSNFSSNVSDSYK